MSLVEKKLLLNKDVDLPETDGGVAFLQEGMEAEGFSKLFENLGIDGSIGFFLFHPPDSLIPVSSPYLISIAHEVFSD